MHGCQAGVFSLCLVALISILASSAATKKYSKWTDWSPCPPLCSTVCTQSCHQVRQKSCLHKEICGDTNQEQIRSCGICIRAEKSSNNTFYMNYKTSELVTLRNRCLPDSHFTNWSNWSKCFDACKRVRFRWCLSNECKRVVSSMEDSAVKHEEFCLPETDGEHCIQLLVNNRPEPMLGQAECEQKLATQKPMTVKNVKSEGPGIKGGGLIDTGVQCGVQNQSKRRLRIVGGSSAGRGDWPWQVAIMVDKQKNSFNDFPTDRQHHFYKNADNFTDEPKYVQYCGGTLIAPQWVLTAAHCVRSRDTGLRKPNMVVMVGETNLKVLKETSSWQDNVYKIKKVTAHEQFEWSSVDNDIALVKLERPIKETQTTGYSCVPDEDMVAPAGTNCIAVGWGKTGSKANKPSRKLKQAVLPLVERETCRTTLNFTITKNQMCAGYPDGNKDSCDGDSGGPLICLAEVDHKVKWVVYGITSFGPNVGCGSGKYGVYVKVNNYSSWIKQVMELDIDAKKIRKLLKKNRLQRKKRHRRKKKRRHRTKQQNTTSFDSSTHIMPIVSFFNSTTQTTFNITSILERDIYS